MSMPIIEQIMEEIRLDLSETEKFELDEYLQNRFGLIGSFGHCEALASHWETNKEHVKELILAWVNKKKKKQKEKKLILVTN